VHATLKQIARATLPHPLYRSLRTAYLVHLFSPRVVEHEYAGVRRRMSLEDRLAPEWYDRDWPEPEEVAVLREHGLAPGSRVFDLGAHQGLVAMMLARLVGDAGRVIAVEASGHNVDVCGRNLALNGVRNVETVWAAVSDTGGVVSFDEVLCGSIDRNGGRRARKVPAVTLDELACRHGHPDALLVDVEGAEQLVLEGGAETIARGALFVVEIHAGCGLEALGGRPEDVLAAFPGYRLLVSSGEQGSGWAPPDGPITERTFVFASPT
jgi:FkbM family methyltransferase